VLVESSGIFSNFCAEKPPLLQAAERFITTNKKAAISLKIAAFFINKHEIFIS
jgi:hypothetical protein